MSRSTDVDVAIESDENENTLQQMAFIAPESNNEFSFSLSRTLVRQLDNMAKYEGISSIDLMIELVTEGLARRIAQDESKPAPSHLMTRNGYVQDQISQPTMSHHSFQNSNGNTRDSQPRHKNYQRNNSNNRSQNRYSQNRNNNYYKSSKKSEG